jgi:hypothetical protein
MATAGGEVTLLATYCGKRLSLTVPTSVKVGDVAHKAAETLNLRKEDLPLSLLYQGNPIDDMAPLDVALAKMKGVTAIHLVKRSGTGKGTTAQRTTAEGLLYAYCSECEGLSKIRPVFKCSSCKEEGGFERKSMEPIDHFDGQYPAEKMIGICNLCKKSDVQPSISFQCVSCESGDKAILRQIRDNIHNIPCMKCGLRLEIVIQMKCSSRHCICLDCFRNMCKVKLDNDKFQNFEGFGYSVNCPGPGDDCKRIPILDPHHFKIVDADPATDCTFYQKFKDKSASNYQPAGDDILCVCKKEITMSSASSVPVSGDSKPETQPTVAGQKWYSSFANIFKKKQEPPRPPPQRKTRRQASCSECRTKYCMECKMVWHTGNCPKVDGRALEDQEFPVAADQARSAQWPSSPK